MAKKHKIIGDAVVSDEEILSTVEVKDVRTVTRVHRHSLDIRQFNWKKKSMVTLNAQCVDCGARAPFYGFEFEGDPALREQKISRGLRCIVEFFGSVADITLRR